MRQLYAELQVCFTLANMNNAGRIGRHCSLRDVRCDVVRSSDGADVEKVLLTVEEAAARLNLGRTSVFGLIKRGEIESVRIGRSRRIPARVLELYAQRLLAEQCGDAYSAA